MSPRQLTVQFRRGGLQVERVADRVTLIALSTETFLMLRTFPKREMSESASLSGSYLAHRDTKAVDSGTPAPAHRYVNSCLLNSAQELFVVDERQECVIVAAAAPRSCRHAFHSLQSH